jgi:hypothetical protein
MTLSRIPRSDCLDSFRLPFPIKEVLKNAVAVPDWPRRRSLADHSLPIAAYSSSRARRSAGRLSNEEPALYWALQEFTAAPFPLGTHQTVEPDTPASS